MLFFYLGGVFQFSLLEGLHFLSHLGDISHGTYHQHQYNAHTNGHQHQALQTLDDALSSFPEQSTPVNDSFSQELRKSPQISTVLGNYDVTENNTGVCPIYCQASIREIYIQKSTPPPQA